MDFYNNNDIRNGIKHFHNLSKFEKNFLYMYLESSYNLIYYAYIKQYKPLQKMFQHLFDNAPVFNQSITLYRGIDSKFKDVELFVNYPISTSFNINTSEEFSGDPCCIFEINVPKGSKFLTYDFLNYESSLNDDTISEEFYTTKSNTNTNTDINNENYVFPNTKDGNPYGEIILQGGYLIQRNTKIYKNKTIIEVDYVEQPLNFSTKLPKRVEETAKIASKSFCHIPKHKYAAGVLSEKKYSENIVDNIWKNFKSPCFKNTLKLYGNYGFSGFIARYKKYFQIFTILPKKYKNSKIRLNKNNNVLYDIDIWEDENGIIFAKTVFEFDKNTNYVEVLSSKGEVLLHRYINTLDKILLYAPTI